MRMLVCGGRTYANQEALYYALDRINAETPVDCVIEGGAPGADCLAFKWSSQRRIGNHVRYAADWAIHGKNAGPMRNQKMIDEGKPDLVVAFPGGKGTADMVRRAKLAGIKTIEVGA